MTEPLTRLLFVTMTRHCVKIPSHQLTFLLLQILLDFLMSSVVLSSSSSLNFRQLLSYSSIFAMEWLLTLYCRPDFQWYCSISSGALRIRMHRGNVSSGGCNDLRIRMRGSLYVFTVGYKWTLTSCLLRTKLLRAPASPSPGWVPLSDACSSLWAHGFGRSTDGMGRRGVELRGGATFKSC